MPNTTLPRVAFTGLDFDNIKQDIINLVQDSPDFNTKWDDFLSSDAGRMLIELFAYIADNLSTRIDWVANENWIGTATQKKSIIRILKILGYNFSLPGASAVNVTMTIPALGYGDSWPGKFYLTSPYTQGLTFTPFSINANDRTGNSKTYEAIAYDQLNDQFDYKSGVLIGDTFASGSGIVTFYDGKTYTEDFIVTTDNSFSFTLSKGSIISKSVRVYQSFDSEVPPREEELLLVNTFLDADAQQSNYSDGTTIPIPYIISVGDNDVVTITFGSNTLLPDASRRPTIGSVIRVFYRIGGGIDSNLVRDAINTVNLMVVTTIADPTHPRTIHVGFENLNEGTGGQNSETSDHAITYAPLTLRTVEKAVTPEDFQILLEANTNVITSVSFGAGNTPEASLYPNTVYTKYNTNISPTEVWNYVVPKQTGWQSLQSSDYNDFYWMSLYLDNRFNEFYNLRPGAFNFSDSVYSANILGKTKLRGDTIKWRADTSSLFYNYVVLDTPTDLKNSFIGDTKFRMKVTNALDTTQQFQNLTNLIIGDSIFVIGADTFSHYRIQESIQAYFISPINLINGIDLSSHKYIKLNVDNLGDTVIDITTKAINIKNVHSWEIAAAINLKLKTNYGANYGDSTGVLGGASVIQTDGTSYLKIQGNNKGDSITARIYLKVPQVGFSDASLLIFGSSITGDTYACYGYNRLTLVRNSSISNFGKVIYELGSLNFSFDPTLFYIHYLKGDTLAIRLGTYHNYNFSQGIDVKWRPIADRVYNTVKEEGDSIPDMSLSDFQLRFTKNLTIFPSLYAIINDWNLYYATPASITGQIIGDTLTVTGLGHYRLKINIDGKGDTIISLFGDSGTSGKYLLKNIGDTINNWLRITYTSFGATYTNFTYATIDDYRRLILTSPLNNNSSSVVIKTLSPQSSIVNELFALDETKNYTYLINGDYYLNYNQTMNLMELIKTNSGNSQMPDANFYVHFLWDRRGSTATDEYTYQTYFSNKKLIGIDNVFKKTIFSTFDIQGIVYFKKAYSLNTIKANVESAIIADYSFVVDNMVNRDFGQSIPKSKLLDLIHSVQGVEFVIISYFGKDMTDFSTNQLNTIPCDFDEIIILSENKFSGPTQIHGIVLTYLVSPWS